MEVNRLMILGNVAWRSWWRCWFVDHGQTHLVSCRKLGILALFGNRAQHGDIFVEFADILIRKETTALFGEQSLDTSTFRRVWLTRGNNWMLPIFLTTARPSVD